MKPKLLLNSNSKNFKLTTLIFMLGMDLNIADRNTALKKGGPVETLLKLKEQGVIRHVGFSIYAPLPIILEALLTDYFEFVNLHFYYFFQHNYGEVCLAEEKDKRVFIISSNDNKHTGNFAFQYDGADSVASGRISNP